MSEPAEGNYWEWRTASADAPTWRPPRPDAPPQSGITVRSTPFEVLAPDARCLWPRGHRIPPMRMRLRRVG